VLRRCTQKGRSKARGREGVISWTKGGMGVGSLRHKGMPERAASRWVFLLAPVLVFVLAFGSCLSSSSDSSPASTAQRQDNELGTDAGTTDTGEHVRGGDGESKSPPTSCKRTLINTAAHAGDDALLPFGSVYVMNPWPTTGNKGVEGGGGARGEEFARRRMRMASQLAFLESEHGVNVTFVGVDAEQEEGRAGLLEELGLPSSMSGRVVAWGRIGNLVGAKRIWRACQEGLADTCLVLEDDVSFTRRELARLITCFGSMGALLDAGGGWDLLSLGDSPLTERRGGEGMPAVDTERIGDGSSSSRVGRVGSTGAEDYLDEVPGGYSWVVKPSREEERQGSNCRASRLSDGLHFGSHAYMLRKAAAWRLHKQVRVPHSEKNGPMETTRLFLLSDPRCCAWNSSSVAAHNLHKLQSPQDREDLARM
jgi:hypothetical protein